MCISYLSYQIFRKLFKFISRDYRTKTFEQNLKFDFGEFIKIWTNWKYLNFWGFWKISEQKKILMNLMLTLNVKVDYKILNLNFPNFQIICVKYKLLFWDKISIQFSKLKSIPVISWNFNSNFSCLLNYSTLKFKVWIISEFISFHKI